MVEIMYRLSFPMVRSKVIDKLFRGWNKIIVAILRKLYPAYCKCHPVVSGVTDQKYDKEVVISKIGRASCRERV